jgi:hypothetical protein
MFKCLIKAELLKPTKLNPIECFLGIQEQNYNQHIFASIV